MPTLSVTNDGNGIVVIKDPRDLEGETAMTVLDGDTKEIYVTLAQLQRMGPGLKHLADNGFATITIATEDGTLTSPVFDAPWATVVTAAGAGEYDSTSVT